MILSSCCNADFLLWLSAHFNWKELNLKHYDVQNIILKMHQKKNIKKYPKHDYYLKQNDLLHNGKIKVWWSYIIFSIH